MQVMYLWRPTKPPEQPKADLMKFIEECQKSGKLVQTGGWDPHGPATLITSKKGNITVTDGPYAESKELIAGFTMIQVRNRDEALEWSRRFPNPVGEGQPAEIEVRQLYEMEDFDGIVEPKTAERFNKIGME